MSSTPSNTLLDTFLSVAQNACTTDNPVLECGADYLTYGELDIISTGLALQIHDKHGLHPTVSVIGENHPYLFAILLATWKLGGIFVPLDCHAPLEMISKMLENVEPTCIVLPVSEIALIESLQASGISVLAFRKNTTMTTLVQRYLDKDAALPLHLFPLPTSSSLAVYLHTSSATSILNLKCVPLTHGVLAKAANSGHHRMCMAWPSVSFDKLKVLSHSPWTHIMAILHDIGGAFVTGGCVIMGVLPSGYADDADEHMTNIFGKEEAELDVLDRLLLTALRSQPDVHVGIPWVLEGFKKRYEQLQHLKMEREVLLVKQMLQKVKYFGIGGAAMTEELLWWILDMGINVSYNIGMTELGGSLFQSRISHRFRTEKGWPIEDCTIEDAKLVLINEEGNEDSHEGELYITSRWISHGYLKFDNSAFSFSPDGNVTFKTGDIYQRSSNGRYLWQGRREDYIQMISSETLDPRPIERTLNACSGVSHCCVVGNKFMREPSDVVCIIIQPASPKLKSKEMAEITRAVASVNKTLLPPLRVAWSRVGILDFGQSIPYTRKGTVFRKKLEHVFGDFLARLLAKDDDKNIALNGIDELKPVATSIISTSKPEDKAHPITLTGAFNMGGTTTEGDIKSGLTTQISDKDAKSAQWTSDGVKSLVLKAISGVLGLDREILRVSPTMTFAEMGMDSNMAVRIVNELNGIFGLQFPLNTCHNLVDFAELSEATLVELGLHEDSRIQTDQPEEPTSLQMNLGEVVIVGQAVRLPGDISTSGSFWDALMNKRKDIMVPVPADRWDHSSFYRPPSSSSAPKICDITFEKAGFVNVTHFDNSFFGISTPEALYISPSTRLTLETVFEAFENACIPVSKVKGSKMGVFVAASLDEGYSQVLFQDRGFDAYSRYYGTGIAISTIAGRISYLLDTHGPASVIDTACSSGLVAVDQAVKYIQSGGGESAVVTAVNTRLWPGSFGFISAQKMASPNSRCATFTNEADGYVPSEASVSFILKSKVAAVRNGDSILAVIKSTDVMHGGKTQGLVSPSVSTQIALQESLLRKAELNPSQIDFIETHGTGTALGDLIEIQGINEVFQDSHSTHPLILGAAKTCIGHTEVAAGLVGLLKAIGTIQKGVVPGLVHLTSENINPSINCATVPIIIPTEATALTQKHHNEPYRGLVLSNGFAGTMAGVVIEEPNACYVKLPHAETIDSGDILMPFVLSAKTLEGLEDYLKRYLAFCRDAEDTDFKNICYTSCIAREHYRYRFACAVRDMAELISSLEERLRNFSHRDYNNINANRIVFAFPGQGSQYQGMASCLAQLYPAFKETLTICGKIAFQLSGFPILSFLLDEQSPSHLTIDDGQIAQICIFVFQYSMAVWLKTLGLEPCAVVGHSLGEISAAVLAGAMTYELGLELVIKRAELFSAKSIEHGGMAVIEASEKDINQLIRHLGFGGRVVIAVYNGPQSHAISGELSCVEILLSNAKAQGFRGTKIKVTQGFHSPLISSSLPALQSWVAEHQAFFSRLKIPLYSTVYGSTIAPDNHLRSTYWVEQARNPVRLSDAVQSMATNNTIDVILDLGPQPFMWAAMQNLSTNAFTFALTSKPTKDQHRPCLEAILSLFKYGSAVNFEKLLSGSRLQGMRTPLPTYPYQRQRHYPHCVPSRNVSAPKTDEDASKGQSKRLVQFDVNQTIYDMLLDHQIEDRRVAPGAALVDFFAVKAESRSVKSITFHSPLVVSSPYLEINGDIADNGKFFLTDGTATNQVCSGVLSPKPTFPLQKAGSDQPPDQIKSQAEVYGSFRAVHLGPSFRNIQNIRMWSTHADITITVQSTQHPAYDRIRKIDCCLHAFGAIVLKEVPQNRDLQNGSFLPSSLDDFTLHSDDLPESFICRYYLPCDVARNYHLMSVAFDVISLSGALLISCRKYSVAWIPTGVATQKDGRGSFAANHRERLCFQQDWVSQNLPTHPENNTPKYEQVLYISAYHQEHSRVCNVLADLTDKIISLTFPAACEHDNENAPGFNASGSSRDILNLNAQIDAALQRLKGTPILVTLDLTPMEASPTINCYLPALEYILSCMKAIQRRKTVISSFIIISEMSVPIHLHSDDNPLITPLSHLPALGAVIQGMCRVFRSEMGLDSQLWALDLPRLESISDSILRNILRKDLAGRQYTLNGLSYVDRTVAYRLGDGGVERFIPILRPSGASYPLGKLHHVSTGTTLIVGMGSIGKALATSLASNGCSQIIFAGRRASENPDIANAVDKLSAETNGKVTYFQADVCDLGALRSCFVEIQRQYGPIENIIHTAAVISDATIQSVDGESFERVLLPKVAGAWNLHLVSQELCPPLKSFALLSSISVSLGNQGQGAYVAGNYFMEVLAAYRLANNLSATALQLGRWESKLAENIEIPNTLVHTVKNEEGIPLILAAMSRRKAVQVIADLNTERLVELAAYAQDPLYREILSAPTAKTTRKRLHTKTEISEMVISVLRNVLELKSSEQLELTDSLISCGIDSIAFAQIRGKILNDLDVEVPMMFLSDSFTMREMIDHIVERSLTADT